MRKLITLAPFIAVVTAQASINLTPSLTQYESLGIIFEQLIFKQEQGYISYEPPKGWTYRGDINRLRFLPPKVLQAEAEIQQTPLPIPRPLDEACMKELAQRALQNVPAGSAKASIVQETENPVLIDGNPTFEVTISYEASGQAFQKSMLFLHLPDTELVFKLTARKSDFEALHRIFRKSLFSWRWNSTESLGASRVGEKPSLVKLDRGSDRK